MTESKLPRLITALPGPNAKRVLELDQPVHLALLHAQLSAGGPARPRRVGRRRGRQRLPRFHRRHRRRRHRPLPSRSRRRHPAAGRRADPHVRHRFLLSEHGGTGAEARRHRARAPIPSASTSAIPARKPSRRPSSWRAITRGREKIIAFYGAFHGRTMGSLSLTASKAGQRKGFGSLLSGIFHVPYPNPYRCPYGKPAEFAAPNAPRFIENELFKQDCRPATKSPPSSSSPFRAKAATYPRPREFLQRVCNDICRRTASCSITDEVQSGMGRTGKWWAGDHAGIEPDILCVAKGIASGLPLSAHRSRRPA